MNAARNLRVVVGLLLCLWTLSACASMRYRGAAALRIDCNVPDATVYIDDVKRIGIALDNGCSHFALLLLHGVNQQVANSVYAGIEAR